MEGNRGSQTNGSPRQKKSVVGQTLSYGQFLQRIRDRIRSAQVKSALAANAELVLHYWDVGIDILKNQRSQGWGAKVIERLSTDLQKAFPHLAGYSIRNLKYMRAFAEAWPDRQFVQQAVAQIPWGHNVLLIDRVKDAETRVFYIRKTIEHGWVLSVLGYQVDTQLHTRQGVAPTNFSQTLPPAESELAQEILKDPYMFQPGST